MVVPVCSVPHHTKEDRCFYIHYRENLGFHVNVCHFVNTHMNGVGNILEDK